MQRWEDANHECRLLGSDLQCTHVDVLVVNAARSRFHVTLVKNAGEMSLCFGLDAG
jgi:hypothetical protein